MLKIFHIRHTFLNRSRLHGIAEAFLRIAGVAKHGQLTGNIIFSHILYRIQKRTAGSEQCCSIFAHAVKCTCLYEALECVSFYLFHVHRFQEAFQIFTDSVCVSRSYYLVDYTVTHIFHRRQAETDHTIVYGKILLAYIYIRRKDLYSHFLAISYIFGNLALLASHACHKRSHELGRIIPLQPRCFICQYGICGSM